MEKHNGYFKKIDFVFQNKGKIREAIKEAREGVSRHRECNGSGLSDPTAAQAVNNVMPLRFVKIDDGILEWPEAWLRVVDMFYTICDPVFIDVMESKYAEEPYQKTCDRIGISQPTRSRYWGKVRHLQELCAVQEGLIRIC